MTLRRLSILLLLSATSLAAQTTSSPEKADIVRYNATIDTVKYVYGVAPPVATVTGDSCDEST